MTSMDTAMLRKLVALLALTLLAGAIGCGDSFGEEKNAELSIIEGEQGLTLERPPSSSRAGDTASIILESISSDRDLKIEKLAIVDAPGRIQFQGPVLKKDGARVDCTFDEEVPVSNDANGDCGEGNYCSDETSTCHRGSLPSTPITIAQGNSNEYPFFLAASDGTEIQCPEPGDDVPDDLKPNYCGKFRIETNASTSNQVFTDGKGTFYFQVDSSKSGKIAVQPEQLQFDNATPGTSAKTSFTVLNNGENELLVQQVSVANNPEILSVAPSNAPFQIEAGGSMSFEVTLDLPGDFDTSRLPIQDFVEVTSSAVNIGTAKTISVSIGGAGGGPVFDADKSTLSFKDSGTQTLNIENTGNSLLIIRSLEGAGDLSLESNYSFKFNGDDIGLNPNKNIPPGESATLDVTFTGGATGGVGELLINHNDKSLGEQSSVLLLAEKKGPYAEVIPGSINFKFEEKSTREFVIRNRGTGPLTVNTEWDTPTMNAPAELKLTAGADPDGMPIQDMTVPAGEFATATVQHLEGQGMQPVFPTVKFPSDTVGATPTLGVNITTGSVGGLKPKITPQFSDGEVEVGQPAGFSSEGSQGNSDTREDRWLLLDRPDGSKTFATDNGGQFTVRPDTPGTYKVGLIMLESDAEAQATMTFEATAAE